MAAGVRNYTQADTGDLGKYIGDKLKSARQMASEAKKETETSGIETGRGYFFGKALAAEFGGDRLARTKGFLKQNPTDTEDPALDKKQRFNNLIKGEISNAPGITQFGLDGIRDDEFTQNAPLKSWLTPLLDTIAINNKKIADGIKSLGKKQEVSIEQQDTTNQGMTSFGSMLDKLKLYLKKDQNLSEEELSIETEQLDLFKQSQEDTEVARQESQLEKQTQYEGEGEGKDKNNNRNEDDNDSKNSIGGLISGLMDGLGEIAAEIGGESLGNKLTRKNRQKSQTPDVSNKSKPKPNLSPGRPSRFGNAFRAVRDVAGGIGSTFMGNKFRNFSEGTAPNPIASGIYDSPTTGTLPSDKGVIPLNRNNSFSDLFDRVKKKNKGTEKEETTKDKNSELLSNLIQIIPQTGGALLVSGVSNIINSPMMGPFGSPLATMFKPILKQFGLPESLLSSVVKPSQENIIEVDNDESGIGGMGQKTGGRKNLFSRFMSKMNNLIGKGAAGFGNLTGQNPQNNPSQTPGPSMGTPYNVTGGQAITRDMFGRGFGVRDGLGSGASSSGHTGQDVPLPEGTPLSLTHPGKVIDEKTGNNGGYGNFVAVQLDNGYVVKSAHHSKNLVKKGDKVGPNPDGSVKAIGEVGSTGLSTGPHMHLDLGTSYDPSSYMVGGLVNPDTFILEKGIVTGGQVKATPTTPSPFQQNSRNAGSALLVKNILPPTTPQLSTPSLGQPSFQMLPPIYQQVASTQTAKNSNGYSLTPDSTFGVLQSSTYSNVFPNTTRGSWA